jgi:hypothetical protein
MLKQEIKVVEKVFHKENEVFQVIAASVDELSFRFIGKNGKKHDITANITVRIIDLLLIGKSEVEGCLVAVGYYYFIIGW